jgi:hypothetical protein
MAPSTGKKNQVEIYNTGTTRGEQMNSNRDKPTV